MKVSTITCQNAINYGARLQCYALAYWLQKQGHEVTVIDYRPYYMRGPRLWYWPGASIKKWIGFILRFHYRKNLLKKKKALDAFSQKYIPLSEKKYYSIDDLRNDPPIADVYIAGSDQIWNATFPNGTDPAYYLDFGSAKIRRESFAASFAITEIEEEKQIIIKKLLQNFDKITVREQSGLKLLNSLGFEGTIQDDPVFLLSAEEWDKIADGTGAGEKYVLVYDFYMGDDIKNEALRIAKENGLKIFGICSKALTYADKNYVYSGPETFVSLIKHATFVLSNSFHGTVFSMIYNVPFKVMDRPDGLNVRMYDLLERRKQSENKDQSCPR